MNFQNINMDNFNLVIIVYAIMLIIILAILYYIYNTLRKEKVKCAFMERTYSEFPTISSTNPTEDFKLYDYYIKSAYNCCAIGDFKNTFVNTCALKQVIRQGVRFLDFEIYSIDNKPVIAVSSVNDYYIKQSYNYIGFDEIMMLINSMCFSGNQCPNPNDPLILHFRIKSKNKPIYENMTQIINQQLEGRLLGNKFSFQDQGSNMGGVMLKDLMGKVMIVVDKSNNMFEDTSLEEYVNLASKSIFCRLLRDYDVKYTPDYKELIQFNRRNMTISMPDLSFSDNNVSPTLHMGYGIQMVAMCYQNPDSNLKYYEKFFSDAGSAFVLKPENLRYKPIVIPTPPPQDPKLSYANRVVEEDYYNFTI